MMLLNYILLTGKSNIQAFFLGYLYDASLTNLSGHFLLSLFSALFIVLMTYSIRVKEEK